MTKPIKQKPISDKSRALLVVLASVIVLLALLGKDGLIAGLTIVLIIGTMWLTKWRYKRRELRYLFDFDLNGSLIVATFVFILLGLATMLLLR